MIRARADVREGWGAELAREINEDVAEMMAEASAHGAKVAAAVAATRSETGHMADVEPLPVFGTADGWEAGFRSPAWYAWFQSAGTLGNRRRKLSAQTERRRSTPSGKARYAKVSGGGIRPLRFLEQGRAAARQRLLELMRQL